MATGWQVCDFDLADLIWLKRSSLTRWLAVSTSEVLPLIVPNLAGGCLSSRGCSGSVRRLKL